MSYLASNLKHLRRQKLMNQQQLADLLQVGRTAIANYETGLANPGHRTLLDIVRIFDISLDEFLHKDLTQPKLKIASKRITDPPGSGYRPFVITVDEAGEENIVLVDTKAAAGYPTRYLEPEYYKELPAFKLPGTDYRNGTFRCFQVEGDSMEDTLFAGDYVIGRFCDNHFRDVREGYIHIMVTSDQVLVKRVINRGESEQKLILISDNEAYPPLELAIDDVKEIWFVKSKISAHIPVKRNDLDKIIGDLTMQVQLLKDRIDKMEKN